MYDHVLVGTDGSPTAAGAVTQASRVAAAIGVPLTLVTAWRRHPDDPPIRSVESRYPGGDQRINDASWAMDVTSDGAAIARTLGVAEVRQTQPVGSPAEALLTVAEEHPDALLTVGTAGLDRVTERLVGNVPHQLTHHSPIDLLLTHAHPDTPGWSRIGLATDGSKTAAIAVQRGHALATALGATPVLVTVARDEARGRALLEDIRVSELDGDARVELHVAAGADPVAGLTAAAHELDLLVLGNKGMSGPSRLLGSVANKVTHSVPTDLLLVNTTR